jgi:hypothetical protein
MASIEMTKVGVMNSEHFYSLFERCMEEVEHVPPESRGRLIEVAEAFLRLALASDVDMPKANAPTTLHMQ